MLPLKFEVRGVKHRNYPYWLLKPGDVVHLEAEPSNEHDRNAIKVVDQNGLHMGYVPAELACIFSQPLQNQQIIFENLQVTWNTGTQIIVTGVVKPTGGPT